MACGAAPSTTYRPSPLLPPPLTPAAAPPFRWRRKLDTPVDFPLESLDLGPYIMSGTPQSRAGGSPPPELPPLYDLVAVSNHFGSTGGGHYTAFAKHSEDGRWCAHAYMHVHVHVHVHVHAHVRMAAGMLRGGS